MKMKLPPEGSLRHTVLSDPDKLAREIDRDVLAPETEIADALRAAFEIVRRQERAACQEIAARYGGRDAEEISEQIGLRNFQDRCPTCNSPSPELHPAMQHGGEVELCRNPYHKRG